MTESHIQATFKEAYRLVAEQNEGAFLPQDATRIMTAMLGFAGQPEIIQKVLEVMKSPNAEAYPDVLPYMKQILKIDSSFPMFWTAGEMRDEVTGGPGYQQLKIAATGIPDALSPDWIKKAEKLDMPTVIGGINKHDPLAQLLPRARKKFKRIRIVDDKLENLIKARKLVEPHNYEATYHQIHRNGIPNGVETGYGLYHIETMEAMPLEESTLYANDLDYTCIDHNLTKKDMAQRLGSLLVTK